LKLVKVEYLNGDGPKYPGYEILIAETTSDLLSKAGDY
jgi:hypothetical protein